MEQPFIEQNNEGTNNTNPGTQNFFSTVEGPIQNQQFGLYMMPPTTMNFHPIQQENQQNNEQPQYQLSPQMNLQAPYMNPSQE